ncbi:MAG: Ig-like domain-containing protein [Candidatus Omnitrophica bacterium]|nr:Ig-like domain-containing protein [Candidatus Omnitrophota bacterium]
MPCHLAHGAVSKSGDKQLESGGTTQGGGTPQSSTFRQQSSIGEVLGGSPISSLRFRIIPGGLGSSASTTAAPPVADLHLSVLYAKTDPLGTMIPPSAWQRDRDPIFIWEPPATGPEVAGYSYAIDTAPDDTIETIGTSFNVATSSLKMLADGPHTFSVKAINSAGHGGPALSLELWVDTTPPQVTASTPSPGALVNTQAVSVRAAASDAASGVDEATVQLLLNGASVSAAYTSSTGIISSAGGAWLEGPNRLELRVSDVVGNAAAPLIWSVTVDTLPPSGSLLINGGASLTTSVHVSLGLAATDAVSGVAGMLISNDLLSGYVEEPYAPSRPLWRLNAVRGTQTVWVKFVDGAGNVSQPVSDAIELALLSPETLITGGPAGFAPQPRAAFAFMCPEGACLFSYAFDGDPWSAWSETASAVKEPLSGGNHYFRVKAAKESNGIAGIQPDEEDPTPAERTWIVGPQPLIMALPKGPPIKLWRLE